MKNIPEPEIKLCTKDVANADDFSEVLETFNCMICFNIPIEPLECDKCDVIFCQKCVKKYRETASVSRSRKCPKCNMSFETRGMNKKLK